MPEKSKYQAAFSAAVRDRILDRPDGGWGIEDSLHVIESLITEALPPGQACDDDLLAKIRQVCNTSQWRQTLEETIRPEGVPHAGKPWLTPQPKGSRKKAEKPEI